MGEKVQGLQPGILKWARETSGFSIPEVAEKMKRDPAELSRWEAGDGAPTYPQLEFLAYKVYKRPLAVFFFPTPPEETSTEAEFRTLPSSELEALAPDTLYHLRMAKAFRQSLIELHHNKNPVSQPIFRSLSASLKSPALKLADSVRSHLGISLNDQVGFSSPEVALKAWRAAVEDAGVHVFKNSIRQKRVSGFSLHHEEFPIIYINDSTTKNRQIFTLFHELVHLLLGFNGMTIVSDLEFGGSSSFQVKVEVFCNKVAGEILLPTSIFRRESEGFDGDIAELAECLSGRYNVSREVVLRKALEEGLVTREEYREFSAAWNAATTRGRSGSGGNYYATKMTYLSEKYLGTILQQHYQGKLDADQVADYLGVKPDIVPKLESGFLKTVGSPSYTFSTQAPFL
ncbi:MAG: ImmA/IrrE family metallo-endopeptidase [Candidatus Sumerlaeia bacterium]|nr:ImmA/IrrE family metallo-endopeptidase [Candidatus Sumerlaeia bacterium]